jgi:2-polyprenyl-3-methyl-5-hydroxy-6-metoxy-1,4-benzoquinol methylase
MTETDRRRPDQGTARADAFAARLFDDAVHALELFGVYLGDRLGLYRALAEHGPLDAAGLAQAAGVDERYAAEWLDQQAAADVLEVVAGKVADPCDRRYALPAGHAEVLLDGRSLEHRAPLAAGVVALAQALPSVLAAFTDGGGVPYHRYGHDLRWAVGRLHRPWFLHHLAADVIPAMPAVEARLLADPPARIADIGCGTGWSSVALALAYPLVRVEGFDSDEESVAEARIHAAVHGVADRVTFRQMDAAAAAPDPADPYDLACAFDVLHDMTDPVGVLAAMRGLVGPEGTVLVSEAGVGEIVRAPANDLERFAYGWSVLHSLPCGLSEPPAAGTGAVLRPPTLRRLALAAGFTALDVLPCAPTFWRCYRLTTTDLR